MLSLELTKLCIFIPAGMAALLLLIHTIVFLGSVGSKRLKEQEEFEEPSEPCCGPAPLLAYIANKDNSKN